MQLKPIRSLGTRRDWQSATHPSRFSSSTNPIPNVLGGTRGRSGQARKISSPHRAFIIYRPVILEPAVTVKSTEISPTFSVFQIFIDVKLIRNVLAFSFTDFHWCPTNKTIGRGLENIKHLNFTYINSYPTAFPYGKGMVLHFYQQQQNSTTKTVHKVINKRLKTYVQSPHTGEKFH